MTKTLIIPGLNGSAAPHWQAWWAATDPSAIFVDLPCPHAPVAALWETELAGMILRHPESILIAHSLGAVLTVRLLNKWPQLRVRAALLVAPAEPSRDPRTTGFGPLSQSRLDIAVTTVASRNDPWMSFAQAKELAGNWGSELVDLGLAGHINSESGYGPWAGGKQLRDALILRSMRIPKMRPQAPHMRMHA